MRAIILTMTLVLAGCATTPVAWVRADGKMEQPGQRQLAQTICQGEMQKANLSMDGRRVGLGTIGDLRQVYAGCMAQQGYIGMSLR